MKHFTKHLFKTRITNLLIVLMVAVGIQPVLSQSCPTAVNAPATINGVSITGAGTGSVGVWPVPVRNACGQVVPTQALYLGGTGAFTYTYTFSQAVNNLTFLLGGTGDLFDENFIFTTNGGTPTIADGGSCYSRIEGNVIYSGNGAPTGAATNGGGGIFTLRTTSPFTTITISGNGGSNGSVIALCATSVAPCPAPSSVAITGATGPYCQGATATALTATYGGTATGFQWYRNGILIAGATASTYTPLTTSSEVGTSNYTVAVINACGSTTSDTPLAVTVIATPVQPTLAAPTQPTCSDANGTFTITNYDASLTYVVSPNATITGSTVTATPGTYTVTATNGTCSSIQSASVTINSVLCPQPDQYSIVVNQTLTEVLGTNDSNIPAGATYDTPTNDPSFTNPSACMPTITLASDGSFTFSCATQGVFHYLVPVCSNGTCIGVQLTITVTSPLPVTLVSFTAASEGEAVNLNWSTTEETNSDRFEIEYGTDGKVWGKIGSVSAIGESRQLAKYSFRHNQPEPGQNLYRLKMIDKDLTYTYSAIRNVNMEGLEKNVVYPNPVLNGKIQIRDWTNIKTLELYNQLGQKLKSFGPADKDKMDVSKLEAGLYLIKVTRANGTAESQKVVIIK